MWALSRVIIVERLVPLGLMETKATFTHHNLASQRPTMNQTPNETLRGYAKGFPNVTVTDTFVHTEMVYAIIIRSTDWTPQRVYVASMLGKDFCPHVKYFDGKTLLIGITQQHLAQREKDLLGKLSLREIIENRFIFNEIASLCTDGMQWAVTRRPDQLQGRRLPEAPWKEAWWKKSATPPWWHATIIEKYRPKPTPVKKAA